MNAFNLDLKVYNITERMPLWRNRLARSAVRLNNIVETGRLVVRAHPGALVVYTTRIKIFKKNKE